MPDDSWVLVPREPTREQNIAGWTGRGITGAEVNEIYHAMLKAAPSPPLTQRAEAAELDAARYRHLRDHCSCHYPMTHEQPAEWSIGWEFQQSTPAQAFGSFDSLIDADIAQRAADEAGDEMP